MKGRGAGIKFLLTLINDAPAQCVTWPLFRDENGYGRVGYDGKLWWAHRLTCTLAHGEAPSAAHEASHSCGNGKDGCVNPRHLSWQTRSRNQSDRRAHGTKALGGWKRPSKRKLSAETAAEIRALKGKLTQREIAAFYSVTDATVRDVFSGKSWAGSGEKWKELTPNEIREVRKLLEYIPAADIATMFSVSRSTIYRIRSGQAYRDVAA